MLFRNTLAQSTRLIIGQITSVILAPILIGRLGLEAFGVWAVTGAAVGYVTLLDLGVTRSLSRFVALHDAHGDRLEIRRVMTVGLVVVLIVGVASVVVAGVAAPLINDLFGEPIPDGDMRTVLLSSAALLAMNLLITAITALPIGLRRMIPPNVAGTFGVLVNFGASVGILLADPRLSSYALANAAAGLPALAAAWLSLRYVWRGPVLARPTRGLVRELVRFGVNTQLSTLADVVNFQTDKLVVGIAVGVRAAAAYEIAARVALAVRELAVLSLTAMIPTATAEIARRGTEVIGTFYRSWSNRMIAMSIGVFMPAILCAPFLLVAWLGNAPKDSEGVLIGLSVAFLAWMSTGVASTTSIAAGYPGLSARNAVAMAVLNLVLTVILAPVFGLWGVMSGTVVAMTAMAARFLIIYHRWFAIPAREFREAALGPVILGVGLAAPLGLLVAFVLPEPTGRWPAFALLVAVGGTFALAYWIGATALDYLPVRLRFPGIRPRAAAVAPPG